MRTAPSVEQLWASHPANSGELYPCLSSDGEPTYENQCAVRMGVALEGAGFSLADFPGARCSRGHGHVIRAQELADWLLKQADMLGKAEIHKDVAVARFTGRKGIVFFRDFWGTNNRGDHIDVWNGSRMSSGDDDYFERSRQVWFWPLA